MGCDSHPSFRTSALGASQIKKTQVSLLPEEGREIRVNKSELSFYVSISKSYVTSLFDATASCSKVILKITTLETVEERAVEGKYPSNWRAMNGMPVGKMGIYNMTNNYNRAVKRNSIKTLWIRVL